jgi:hypothetical protein
MQINDCLYYIFYLNIPAYPSHNSPRSRGHHYGRALFDVRLYSLGSIADYAPIIARLTGAERNDMTQFLDCSITRV